MGGRWTALLGLFAAPAAGSPGTPAGWAGHAQAVLVHNQDPAAPALFTITLAHGVAPYELVVDSAAAAAAAAARGSPTSASLWDVACTVQAAWDDAPGLPGYQVYLDAGDRSASGCHPAH